MLPEIRDKARMLALLILLNIMLEVLIRTLRAEKEIRFI